MNNFTSNLVPNSLGLLAILTAQTLPRVKIKRVNYSICLGCWEYIGVGH